MDNLVLYFIWIIWLVRIINSLNLEECLLFQRIFVGVKIVLEPVPGLSLAMEINLAVQIKPIKEKMSRLCF